MGARLLVEVGGTIGDIEFLADSWRALRQLRNEIGREICVFVHATWLPTIGATGEMKTKPTQHESLPCVPSDLAADHHRPCRPAGDR